VRYLFTDSDLAADRLRYLAEVYAATTRQFVLQALGGRPGLVVDLGCGPGCTTHLLAEVSECDKAVGLDNSKHFISLADSTKTESVSFLLHDVTREPFPVGPAHVLYCRYLLTHLASPLDAMVAWGTQLRPGGLLLVEEVEWIRNSNPVFAHYLRIVEAMLAAQSNQLYVGPWLNGMEDTDVLKQRSSLVRHVPVMNHQAATMFHMNIQSWKHQPFVRKNYAKETIAELEGALAGLAAGLTGTSEIEWGLRQMVFERPCA